MTGSLATLLDHSMVTPAERSAYLFARGELRRKDFGLEFALRDLSVRKRAAIFASKSDHCLLDLLWRQKHGELAITIPMVIANHQDVAEEVRSFGVPFCYVPSSGSDKSAAEAAQVSSASSASSGMTTMSSGRTGVANSRGAWCENQRGSWLFSPM